MNRKECHVHGGYCAWYEAHGLLGVYEPTSGKNTTMIAQTHQVCERLGIALQDIRIFVISFHTQWVKKPVDLFDYKSMTQVKFCLPEDSIRLTKKHRHFSVDVMLPPAVTQIELDVTPNSFTNESSKCKWHVRFLNHSLEMLTHMVIADPGISVSAIALPTQLQQATRDDDGDQQQPFLLFDGKFAADEHGDVVYQYDFAEIYSLFNGLIDSRYIVEMIRQYLMLLQTRSDG